MLFQGWALNSLSRSQGRLPREQEEGQGGWASPGGEVIGVGPPTPPLEPSIPLFGCTENVMFAFPSGFPVARDPFLPKKAPSATFTFPYALRGQRPRRAHGPSAAFQDGQPPALASPAAGQLPGAGVNTAGTPPPESLHGAELGADHPGPRALACPPTPQRTEGASSPMAPWQVSRTIFSLRNTPLCHEGCRFPDLSCPGRCGCGKLLTIPGVRGAG